MKFTDQIVDFYKILSDRNIQTNTAGATNVTDKQFYYIEEDIIFLSDLNCPNIVDYFKKVTLLSTIFLLNH